MSINSAYPELTTLHKKWLTSIVDGMVKHPKAANCVRVKAGLDLEIVIVTHPADREIFSPEVCESLQSLLGAMTGMSPVVYLDDNPHPEAEEVIYLSRSQV